MARNLLEVCDSLNFSELLQRVEDICSDTAPTPVSIRTSPWALKISVLVTGSHNYSSKDSQALYKLNRGKSLCASRPLSLEGILTQKTGNCHELLEDLYKVLSMLVYETDKGVSYEIINKKFLKLTHWIDKKNSFSREEWRCAILSIFCFQTYNTIIDGNLEMELRDSLDLVFNSAIRTKIVYSYTPTNRYERTYKLKLSTDNKGCIHYADVPRVATQSYSKHQFTATPLYPPVIACNAASAAAAAAAAAASAAAASAAAAAASAVAASAALEKNLALWSALRLPPAAMKDQGITYDNAFVMSIFGFTSAVPTEPAIPYEPEPKKKKL